MRRSRSSATRKGIDYWALKAVLVGNTERALGMLELTLERGWSCNQASASDPLLDDLRSNPCLSRVLREMEARQREAEAAFVGTGGNRLLGLKV